MHMHATKWFGSHLKKVGVGFASLLIVALVCLYVWSPTTQVFAMSTSSISYGQTVFYGSITNTSNKPIANARVALYHYTSAHRQVVDAVVFTNAKGVYRTVLHRTGREYYQFSYKGERSKQHYLTVKMGHAYRISAHLQNVSIFAFLPLFNY